MKYVFHRIQAALLLAVLCLMMAFWFFSGSHPGSNSYEEFGKIVPTLSSRPDASAGALSSQGNNVIKDFSDWVGRHQPLDALPTGELQSGERLAMARRIALKEIIRRDPKEALALAVSPALKQQLPPLIGQHLEDHISGFGTINPVSSDSGGFEVHAKIVQMVSLEGRLYSAHAYGRRVGQNSYQEKLPLWGIAIDSEMAVAEGAARLVDRVEAHLKGRLPGPYSSHCAGCGCSLADKPLAVDVMLGGGRLRLCEPGHLDLLNTAYASAEGGGGGFTPAGAGPVGSWTLGPKKLLFMVVQFADQSSPPTTRQVAETTLAQVEQFYREASYGLTTVTSVVTDPLLLGKTTSEYQLQTPAVLYNDAVAVARTSGWDVDLYDFAFVRYFNGPGSAAFSLVGQKGAWVQLDHIGVFSHELGHNYGLNHANSWVPSTAAPWGPGSTIEYGDVFDTMGPNRGAFNPYEKSLLHWIPDSACVSVTNNGTYRLHSFDISSLESNRAYALKVGRDVRDYWLDYRSEYTSDSFAPYTLNGVEIRWPRWSKSLGGSTLLDTTPGTILQHFDSPLTVGRTFSDTEADVYVTTLARSPIAGEWLDIVVNVGPFANNNPPTASMSTSATDVSVDQPLTFTVSASDPDGDALAYGWDFGRDSGGNSSDQDILANNSSTQAHAWSNAGEYEVSCRVSDMKGKAVVVRKLVRVESPSSNSISGRVVDEGGSPMADIPVFNLTESGSANDPSYRIASTDQNGLYRLSNIPTGRYIVAVMPTITRTFVPSGAAGVVEVGPSAAGIDFIATLKPLGTIRGIVRDANAGVPNVMVRAGSETTISAANGEFLFSNLPPGSYTLTASRAEDQFIANDNPFYLDGTDLTNVVLSRVLYQLSGNITGLIGSVTVGTSEPGRVTTAVPNPAGFSSPWVYRLNVPRGSWNLYAAFFGNSYTFSPVGFTNPVLVLGTGTTLDPSQNVQTTTLTNLHFQAVFSTSYTIRGRVTSGGNPLANAMISTGPATSLSDSLGYYRITGRPAGTYVVTASHSSYTFSNPEFSNPVSVGPDATNINFLAVSTTTNPPTITAHPQSRIVSIGSDATFSVSATGTPSLTYQWYFNSSTLLAGATNSLLTVTDVQDSDGGLYSVVVSNNSSSVTSSNALLTVNHLPVPAAPVLERYAFTGGKLRIAAFLGSDPDGDSPFLYSAGPGSAAGGTVTANLDWVIYTPPPGFTNTDSFPFVVSDGRGGLSSGTASVNVTFDNVVPQNFRAEIFGDGSVRLIFDGVHHRTYSIEFTENLSSPLWKKLADVTADEHGVFVYIDFLPTGSPQRFYRAAWP